MTPAALIDLQTIQQHEANLATQEN